MAIQVDGTQIKNATVSDDKLVTAFLPLNGSVPMAADLDMQTGIVQYRIVNLGAPSSLNDAARLVDVEAAKYGLDPKDSVRCTDSSPLPACTYSAGLLTADANGALPVQDGTVTLIVGNRILLTEMVNPVYNGIYVVLDPGADDPGGIPWSLLRADDANVGEVNVTTGMSCYIEEGFTYRGQTWVLSTLNPITIGVTGLTFVQLNGPHPASSITTEMLEDGCVDPTKESNYGRYMELGLGVSRIGGFPIGGIVAGVGDEWKISTSAVPDSDVRIESSNFSTMATAYTGETGVNSGIRFEGFGVEYAVGSFSNPPSGAGFWRIGLVYQPSPTQGLAIAESAEGTDLSPPSLPALPSCAIELAAVKVKFHAGSPVIESTDIGDRRRRAGKRAKVDTFVGDGSTTTFCLSHMVSMENRAEVQVSRNGLQMEWVASGPVGQDQFCVEDAFGVPTEAGAMYSGSQVVFGTAPSLSDNIFVFFRF